MDKTKLLVFSAIFFLVVSLVSVFALAKPNTEFVSATNNKAGNSISVPAHAVEVADGVFSLGTALDVDGRIVQGYLFLHDKRENAKPSGVGGNKGVNSQCYNLLASGARWKTTELYITGGGIDSTLTELSLNAWDSEVLFDVFGARDVSRVVDGADTANPDGKNEVEFAYLGATNTIAQTIVWGIFYGPPKSRELVEWDAVFNTAYPFGDATVNQSVMDYHNIATHEFGHALGLGHPESTCTEETMYAYAEFGETKKRDLNAGDIAGINELY